MHVSVPIAKEDAFGATLTTRVDELAASVEKDGVDLAPSARDGTITIVFTDIEESTRLTEAFGDRGRASSGCGWLRHP